MGQPSEKPLLPVRQPQRILKSVPISLGQSRYWFLLQLLADQNTHNVATYYRIEGDLRIRDLIRATHLVCSRHESLRTFFRADPTARGEATQNVMPGSPLRIERKDIQCEEDVEVEYAKIKSHEFDIESGGLLRLVLLTLSPSIHFLLVTYHHIVMDALSWQVFLVDLEKAYEGQSLGAPPRQYTEFSMSQRQALESGAMDQQLNYWRKIFPGSNPPSVLPLLPMARISSRMALKVYDTHQVVFRLEPALLARVKSFSRANGASPFHLYLAAFKVMLFSFVDTQDLTIGIADSGRSEANLRDSIGFFLNLLPLRFYRQEDQNFFDAMIEARNTHYRALENSRVPFDVLLAELNVARSSLYSPFFQAFLDYRQDYPTKHAFGNTQFEIKTIDHGQSAYDITLDVTDSSVDTVLMMRAQKSLYDMTATELFSETFVHLLETLTSAPTMPLRDTPLYSEEQRTQAIQVGRGPGLPSDWPATLPHRIDQIARENGDKVALMDGFGNKLNYNDMINRIEAIAEALASKGASSGSRVPVFQQAASDWVCSMLAIMRVGAIYVPLDLRNPLPRLASVIKDCEPVVILVDATTLDDVPQLGLDGVHVIDVTTVASKPTSHIPNHAHESSPAAIMYTSGSTGKPKGIVLKHSGLRNEIEGYTKMWKLGAERTLQQSAFTFNHSLDQIYTGLTNGGSVYIVPWSARGNPLEITKIIHKQAITYTKATPSEYLLWMQYGDNTLHLASEWRYAFGGGESLTTTVTQEFAKLNLPNLRFYNSYGPTEISISSTKMEIMYRDKELENMGRIPCGYSLPNYDTYIVDEELRPVPVGCPGEICIGGAGVSLGYFKNAELTDKHFVSNPFATPEDITKGWTRMYRTGDIAHLRKDGAMVFHNRIEGDSQVKIRGLRIDLSDIESNIIMAAGGALKEAVVTLREGDLLVAHVIFAPNRGISDTTAFLEQLLSNLDVPQYMIPVAAIALDKFPLSNHSKVDRKAIKALPLPKRTQSSQQDVKLTEAMLKLRDIWREVLGQINKDLGLEIGPSTSFFQIGGNSLTLIKLQAKIRERLRIHVSLDQLFKKTTLAGMTNQLQGRQSKDSEVSSIDWTLETTLESDLAHTAKNDVSHEAPPRTPPEVIILTGATGFLGQELLKQLLDSKTIRRVYCLAIRKPRDNQPSLFHHSKVTLCHGDLSAPRLGLSVEEAQKIFGEADAVIHSGADVSFMKSYSTLHPTNVGSTKELVRLCLPRRLPFHFISTTAVARISGRLEFGLESVAPWPPSSNFRNNYVFTKWVCEVYLENVSRQFNLPMLVYRPSTITGEGTSEVDLMSNVLKYSKLTGTVPTSDTWKGSLDFIDVKEAARMIAKSLAKGMKREDQISYIHVSGGTQVPIDGLAEFMESVEKREFATVPFTEWIEDVAEVGMNPLLVTYLRGIGTRRATLVFPKLERGQVQGTLATLAPTRSSSSARMWKGAEAASGIAA